MTTRARLPKTVAPISSADDSRFAEVVAPIEAARGRAYHAVNSELVSLYWRLGEHLSQKISSAEWGDGVVDELAAALSRRYPGLRGFARPNLGKLGFYVEALDRDVKKAHERGVLLCASKDDEVVEYALARTASPTLGAEYRTMLPSQAVLREKLHQLYAQLAPVEHA